MGWGYTAGPRAGAGYAAAANARGVFPELKAIVALQPALNTPLVWKGSLVPSLILSGQCDEQVGTDGPVDLARELAVKQKSAVVITASVARATHIGLVAGGGSDQIGLVRPVNTGACASKLAPQVAQGAVARLTADSVSYTHLRAHETVLDLVCRLLLDKKKH